MIIGKPPKIPGVIAPQNAGAAHPGVGNPVAIAPQNAGLPIGLPNVTTHQQPGNPIARAIAAPAAPGAAAPPPAAAPIDFSTLVGSDPQYIREQAAIKQQNDLAIDQLAKQFATTRQSYQDNANAHGALFSGAAVHAQNYAGQQYADQGAQQALNYGTQAGNSLGNAWQRILNQLAGGSA